MKIKTKTKRMNVLKYLWYHKKKRTALKELQMYVYINHKVSTEITCSFGISLRTIKKEIYIYIYYFIEQCSRQTHTHIYKFVIHRKWNYLESRNSLSLFLFLFLAAFYNFVLYLFRLHVAFIWFPLLRFFFYL